MLFSIKVECVLNSCTILLTMTSNMHSTCSATREQVNRYSGMFCWSTFFTYFWLAANRWVPRKALVSWPSCWGCKFQSLLCQVWDIQSCLDWLYQHQISSSFLEMASDRTKQIFALAALIFNYVSPWPWWGTSLRTVMLSWTTSWPICRRYNMLSCEPWHCGPSIGWHLTTAGHY